MELPTQEGGRGPTGPGTQRREAGESIPVGGLGREGKERWPMAAVDQLNLWGGRGTVRAVTLGTGGIHKWQRCREHKDTLLYDVGGGCAAG